MDRYTDCHTHPAKGNRQEDKGVRTEQESEEDLRPEKTMGKRSKDKRDLKLKKKGAEEAVGYMMEVMGQHAPSVPLARAQLVPSVL